MNMDYVEMALDFLFSLKWLLAIVVIMAYKLIDKYINIIVRKYVLDVDKNIKNTNYDESKTIEHLDYIIDEALTEYVLLNIKPKDIYYINSKIENEIVNYLKTEVPKRLSKTLITHLSFIYNNDYVGEFIGKHIYMTVLEYVLKYNQLNERPEALPPIKNDKK